MSERQREQDVYIDKLLSPECISHENKQSGVKKNLYTIRIKIWQDLIKSVSYFLLKAMSVVFDNIGYMLLKKRETVGYWHIQNLNNNRPSYEQAAEKNKSDTFNPNYNKVNIYASRIYTLLSIS